MNDDGSILNNKHINRIARISDKLYEISQKTELSEDDKKVLEETRDFLKKYITTL